MWYAQLSKVCWNILDVWLCSEGNGDHGPSYDFVWWNDAKILHFVWKNYLQTQINTNLPFVSCFFLAPCKEIQDSLRFWIPCRGFRIQITGFSIFTQWILDSRFRISTAVFQIPRPSRDSGFHKQKFPGFPHMGRFFYIFLVKVLQVRKHTPISFPEVAILRSATGMLVSLEKSNKGSGDEICYANPSIPSWHDL